MKNKIDELYIQLRCPVSGNWLVIFRVGFGIILLWEMINFMIEIPLLQLDSGYRFPWPLFEWIQPWQGNGLYTHSYAMCLLAILMSIGLFYRLSTILFCIGFIYIFLLDQTFYKNHSYLIAIICFLMVFYPAGRIYSLDNLLFTRKQPFAVPKWTLFLLRIQLGIPYFFGGLSKINEDWLVRGIPLRKYITQFIELPQQGTSSLHDLLVTIAGYSTTILDILALPLLLIKQTRIFMILLLFLFHIHNHFAFNIGVFPWLMIISLSIYLEPDWPDNFTSFLSNNLKLALFAFFIITLPILILFNLLNSSFQLIPSVIIAGMVVVVFWQISTQLNPQVSTLKKLLKDNELNTTQYKGNKRFSTAIRHNLLITFIMLWLMIQTGLPLRHYFITGDVNWTEEGGYFSWRMKLRGKAGTVIYFAVDPITQKKYRLDHDLLIPYQQRILTYHPYMMMSFGKYLARQLEKTDFADYEIRIKSNISLNHRQAQPAIDPDIDISKQDYKFFSHNPWITQLK